jgi:hypothetical protein
MTKYCNHCPSRETCHAVGCTETIVVMHRDKGDGFTHSDSERCSCAPYSFNADDPRTADQIMADVEV